MPTNFPPLGQNLQDGAQPPLTLEFGSGTHIDIRFGIRDYGPIGFDNSAATKVIKTGFVGTPATIQGVRDWMAQARQGVPEKLSKKPKFRPAFPGSLQRHLRGRRLGTEARNGGAGGNMRI